jgi:peptidoglycan/xylan/chitin deacetylase (PgdA/CDA1 family)
VGASRALSKVALRAARTGAAERLAGMLERVDRRAARAITVLTYHRVDDPARRPQLDPALLSAAPAEFERQVAYVAERCSALSLPELLAIRRGQAEAPEHAVLVTFDDAYRDFAENAWPILRDHGVPATLFVPTAYAADRDRRFWWDRLHAAFAASNRGAVRTSLGTIALGGPAERLEAHRRVAREVGARPHADAMRLVDEVVSELGSVDPGAAVLSWDALRVLSGEGVALAAHTRTHPRLDRLPAAEAADEVRGSLADLEREVGSAPAAFAFPQGGHSGAAVAAVEAAGVEVAFTTVRGVNRADAADWLRLRRINVGRRSSVGAIRLQILAGARMRNGATP